MNFTVDEKTFAITAFEYAISWEESLIDAHRHCNAPEDQELKKKCEMNIKAFKALRKRFNRARRYSASF